MELRGYQKRIKGEITKKIIDKTTKLVVQSPTGSGKTVLFVDLTLGAASKCKKVLICVHREELLDQAQIKLCNAGLQPVRIDRHYKANKMNMGLAVAMSPTLKSRMKRGHCDEYLKSIDILIIDEAHERHADSIISEVRPDCLVLGFTATPVRYGRGLGLGDIYQGIVHGPQVLELIGKGSLVPWRPYGIQFSKKGIRKSSGDYRVQDVEKAMKDRKLYSGVVNSWLENCKDTKTIVFCAGVESSKRVCARFEEIGIAAEHLDSDSATKTQRNNTLRRFKEGKTMVLCNCGLFIAGLDEPSIETVVLFRCTSSQIVYRQCIGRGSRPSPGKTHFNVLDFGGNIIEHGHYDDNIQWFLEKAPERSSSDLGTATYKNCPECGCFIPSNTKKCSFCGWEKEETEQEMEEARLTLLPAKEIMEISKHATFEELYRIQKLKQWHKSWVFRVVRSRGEQELIKFANWTGPGKDKVFGRKWIKFQMSYERK